MRRIVLILSILWLWLSPSNWSEASHLVSTATPSIPLQYKEILHIPAVNSNYGVIPINWVAWNPVTSNFAAVYEFGDPQNPIRILNGGTGSNILDLDSLQSTGNSTFAWSPDGKRIAAILGSPNAIKIWTLAGNQNISPIVINRIGEPSRYPIFWSKDGLELAETEIVDPASNSETGSQTLFIWNTQSGKLISRHSDMTIGSWSPDGKMMAVLAYQDRQSFLRIVTPDTFQVLLTFPTAPNDATTGVFPYIVWTPDSHQLIGATCDLEANCTLWIWDTQSGKVDYHFDQNNVSLGVFYLSEYTFALNASGTLLATTWWNAGPTVYLWDVQSGKLLNSLETNDGITSLSWGPTQDILLLGSRDGTIQQWKVQRTSGTPAVS